MQSVIFTAHFSKNWQRKAGRRPNLGAVHMQLLTLFMWSLASAFALGCAYAAAPLFHLTTS